MGKPIYIKKNQLLLHKLAIYVLFIQMMENECGSFEILIEDKNDYKDIITSKMVQQSYKCYN